MIVRNVKVFGEDRRFREGEITIRDGVFAQNCTGEKCAGEEILDGEGCYAIPGLIDLHFHGCMGQDFCDGTPEAFQTLADYEASVGVTAICPATMTLPAEELERILAAASAWQGRRRTCSGALPQGEDGRASMFSPLGEPREGSLAFGGAAGGADLAESGSGRRAPGLDRGADLVGINMEGPFISAEKKGAQDPANILPCDAELFRRFQRAAGGLVKFIGVAPEREGASAFIDEVKGEVHVSLAHTNAGYEEALAAFSHGADHAVHLYNAMSPFGHRDPGVAGAVFDSPQVMAELICDGIHVHPAMVRATFRMLGPDRVILISDSMRATGMGDGRYLLGGLPVEVHGKRATLAEGGAIAGSVTNLMDCLRTAVQQMGIPLETAVAAATINPARSLGIDAAYGSIAPGKRGDLALLDGDLNLQAVIKDGRRIL